MVRGRADLPHFCWAPNSTNSEQIIPLANCRCTARSLVLRALLLAGSELAPGPYHVPTIVRGRYMDVVHMLVCADACQGVDQI